MIDREEIISKYSSKYSKLFTHGTIEKEKTVFGLLFPLICKVAGEIFRFSSLSYMWMWFIVPTFPFLPILTFFQMLVICAFVNSVPNVHVGKMSAIFEKEKEVDPIMYPSMGLLFWGFWYIMHCIVPMT